LLGVRREREEDWVARTGAALGLALRAHLGRRRDTVARVGSGLALAMRGRLGDARRRVDAAAGTLEAFTRGVALVTGPGGMAPVLEPGATLIIETADATVTATIDHVVRHDGRDASRPSADGSTA
jgi:hypothetical protein